MIQLSFMSRPVRESDAYMFRYPYKYRDHAKTDSFLANHSCNTEGFDKDELLKQETELRRSMSPFGSDG